MEYFLLDLCDAYRRPIALPLALILLRRHSETNLDLEHGNRCVSCSPIKGIL